MVELGVTTAIRVANIPSFAGTVLVHSFFFAIANTREWFYLRLSLMVPAQSRLPIQPIFSRVANFDHPRASFCIMIHSLV